MPTFDVRTVTVPLSGQLSGEVAIAGGDLFGLWVPVVTSCTIVLRGSFDATSANFVTLTNPAGSGDWTFAAAGGSRGVTLQDVAFPYPFFKLFCSVAQAAARDILVIAKR